MRDVAIVMIPPIVTGIGFLTRYFWERHIKHIKDIERNDKDEMHIKLKRFYYPLLFNFERLSHLWKVVDAVPVDEEIMRIHEENQDIIKNNIVSAKPIPRLFTEIMKYDKHVTILKALKRSTTHEHKPRAYEAEYPEDIKSMIKLRIKSLENTIHNV